MGGCRFGYTEDGLPGYKKEGADTVYPFNSQRITSIKAGYRTYTSGGYLSGGGGMDITVDTSGATRLLLSGLYTDAPGSSPDILYSHIRVYIGDIMSTVLLTQSPQDKEYDVSAVDTVTISTFTNNRNGAQYNTIIESINVS